MDVPSGPLAPRSARRKRVSNRDRILETSLELFNERGTVGVSTNTIAEALSISAGNLYYHFDNKEQIIRELFAEVTTLVPLQAPEVGRSFSPEDFAEFFRSTIDAVWRFRFIFRDLDELVERDPEFAAAFRAEAAKGTAQIVGVFDSLIAEGAMEPAGQARDLDRLCNLILLVFFNWLRFVTTVAGRDSVGVEDIADGALHAFVMLEGYLRPDYARETRQILERLARESAT